MNSRSRSFTARWSSPTYVRYTGKLATISARARVRLPRVKSREERCSSEMAFSRCASMFSSDTIDGCMTRRLHSEALPGEGVTPVGEHFHPRPPRPVHDEPLAFVDDLREGRALLDETGIQELHRPCLAAIDEDAVQEVQKLVPGGPGNGPVPR